MLLRGRIVPGFQHFTTRMTRFPDVFRGATGCTLYPGTINVRIDRPISIAEAFRIAGTLIEEPEQDLLFEPCRINGYDGFRIRPYRLATGQGGHGDDTLEISCAGKIPDVDPGREAVVELFRDEIETA
jgi:CTP-dependent riboflavin kinase